MEFVQQFRNKMESWGIVPPEEIVPDGQIHRFPTNGQPSDRAGWYILYGDGIPAGRFGNWRTDETHSWRANIGRKLTKAEQAADRARVEDMHRKREAEERERHEEAHQEAKRLWESAEEAPHDYSYLARKGVKSYGLRIHEGRLIVAVTNRGHLHSLQFIAPNGNKYFLAGGRVQGCYFPIGTIEQATKHGLLCIAEGYATGATVHEATGHTVAVAFYAGNMVAVAREMRSLFPDLQLILCADDDAKTKGNPGLTKATEAARAVGGLLAVPDFGPTRPDDASDFNDMAAHCGLEAVVRAITEAKPIASGSSNEESNSPRGAGDRRKPQDKHKTSSRKRRSVTTKSDARPPYQMTAQGIVWMKPLKEGDVLVPLTNFTAKIVASIVVDDGVEVERNMELEGTVNGRTVRFRIPVAQFNPMNWAIQHLGPNAVVYAGFGVKDHARVAIQLLSNNAPERRVFAHLGWTKIDGTWRYLHAGGSIGPISASAERPGPENRPTKGNRSGLIKEPNGPNGPNGPLSDDMTASPIEIYLPPALQHYRLPKVPTGPDRVKCIRASLKFLDLGPNRVVVPAYAAIFRSPLGPTDFSIHIGGPTGAGKSELAALAQQHYGPDMDARHLPAAWSSTANALEVLAFTAKDALLVIDDFCPTGSQSDIQRLHREADRLLRGQGNHSGRLRLRADASLRPAKAPRGLIMSTGEEIPSGQSLRARIYVIEIGPDDLDFQKLGQAQADARQSLYAGAMASFISSLAPRYDDLQRSLKETEENIRRAFINDGRLKTGHRRSPDILASLLNGIRLFLEFAFETGAVTRDEFEALLQKAMDGLTETAEAQVEYQTGAEPTQLFLELLRSAIASGRAHFMDGKASDIPENPELWGWKPQGDDTLRPCGNCVGWITKDDVYLEPIASYAAAQSIGRDSSQVIPIGARTLQKRLKEKGVLKTVDKKRKRNTIRMTLRGVRRTVLHLDTKHFGQTAQTAQAAQNESEDNDEDDEF